MSTQIQVGDIVEVGPAYRMGGTYERDGSEGFYLVSSVSKYGGVGIAYLTPGVVPAYAPDERDDDLYISQTRCTVRLTNADRLALALAVAV